MKNFSNYFQKYCLLIVFAILCTFSSYAQDQKQQPLGIEILQPESVSKIPYTVREKMFELTKIELTESKRFKLVEQNNYNQALVAQDRQMGIQHRNVNTASQGYMQAAYYQLQNRLLDFGVTRIYSVNSETNEKTFTGFKGWIIYSYELTDVESGTSIESRMLKIESPLSKTEADAVANMVVEAKGWLNRFLLLAFPVETTILEVEKNLKGNKIQQAYLLGGNDLDLYRGLNFKVNKVSRRILGNREFVQQEAVGTLTVKDVQDEFSMAKSGLFNNNKKLLAAYESGVELQLVSSVVWPVLPTVTQTIENVTNPNALNDLVNLFKKKDGK